MTVCLSLLSIAKFYTWCAGTQKSLKMSSKTLPNTIKQLKYFVNKTAFLSLDD